MSEFIQDNERIIDGSARMADVAKGAVAGLVAGLVASFVMSEFQSFWKKAAGGDDQTDQQSKDEPATVKAAEKIAEVATDHNLEPDEKKIAGPLMHYLMGGTSGLIYGAASELVPEATVAGGLPFGAAVWMIADNIAVPALGFSKPPTDFGLSTHAYALASHLIYGMTTEAVRETVRDMI
jgi:putative membrane protein